MSREKKLPKTDGIGFDNSPVAGERHEAARGGMSRELAHREMDRFRAVGEYKVRKLAGRRSEQVTPRNDTKPAQASEAKD